MKNQSNDSWDKIEGNWRKKLQEQSIQPSEELWSKLDAKLSKEEHSKIVIVHKNPFKRYWTWAAIFAIAIGLNWFYRFKQTTELPLDILSKTPSSKAIKQPSQNNNNILVKVEQKIQPQTIIQKHPKAEAPIENNLTKEPIEISQSTVSEEQKKEILVSPSTQDTSQEIWVKVSIDPIPANIQAEKLSDVKPTEKKKRNFFKLLKQLKNIVNGENNLEEVPDNLSGSIHQVANTYYRTEEKLKQTFQ